uniref:F-box domain-containing protein n=1 Tax=Ascaris lumbricoides TaxID=6252 RepID=A0A0M3HVI9_ASCLU
MNLSDDVWNDIFAHLDVESRHKISQLNKRLCSLFAYWNDITMISLKGESAHIAGDYLRYSTKCPLKVILKRCPNINTVTVQNALSEKRLRYLEKIDHITDLSIPSCLLHLYAPSIDRLLCQSRLKQLHILQRYDNIKTFQNMLRMPYAIRISTLPLTILEMSGVVLKGNILKVLCEGLRVTLQELLICGSLCNSPDFDEYITAIALLSNLKVLEMPPSLFSLCHRKIPKKLVVLGQLPLQRFSIYIHYYNAPNIALLLNLLPKTLKELIVFRTTEFDSSIWEKDFANATFKVYFCHLNDILVEPDWMCGNNELLTHTLWLPPYNYSYGSQRFDPVEWYENVFEQIKDDDEWSNVEVLRTALERSETEITDQLTLTTAAW